MNAHFGHNEMTARLGLLAEDAKKALGRVADGEADTIEGWLAYGAALNEGRALYPVGDNERFSDWVSKSQLAIWPDGGAVGMDERAAAMWAAGFPEQFEIAKAGTNARTVRGIHKHWGIIDAERKAAEQRALAEAERLKAEEARKAADAAKAKAAQEQAEARARADAEAAARKAAQDAKDEAERKAAQARANAEAAARAEAEKRAKESAQAAKDAAKSAKQSDKSAKTADNSAKRSEKKAANAKKGDAATGENYRTVTTGENEWYTPAEFAEYARDVMGGIDLDPASCADANEVIRAAKYYTQQDDGLQRQWSGRVWLNPPYSRDLMLPFCEKLAASYDAGDIEQAILVSHNNTDTAWFHRLGQSCAAICFPKRRIKFYRGEEVAAPVNGQAFFYFGSNPSRFVSVFGNVGLVVVPA